MGTVWILCFFLVLRNFGWEQFGYFVFFLYFENFGWEQLKKPPCTYLYYKDDGREEKAVQTQLVICKINHDPCWLVNILGWTFHPFAPQGEAARIGWTLSGGCQKNVNQQKLWKVTVGFIFWDNNLWLGTNHSLELDIKPLMFMYLFSINVLCSLQLIIKVAFLPFTTTWVGDCFRSKHQCKK